MSMRKLNGNSVVAGVLALLLAGMAAGCDEDFTDHQPPAGSGSLIVDNHTADDLSIFVDGRYTDRVGDYSDRILDMDPGFYRLVLTGEDNSDRSYRTDVDILEGQLTILEVWTSADPHGYDVTIRFD